MRKRRKKLYEMYELTHCEVASYVVGTQRNVMPLQADVVLLLVLYFGAILLAVDVDVKLSATVATDEQSDGGKNSF